MYLCIYVGMYVCMYVFVYVCMYVCMYVCVYVRYTYSFINCYPTFQVAAPGTMLKVEPERRISNRD